MYDDIAFYPDDERDLDDRQRGDPQLIGDILADLLAQYESRFPELTVTVVETAVA